MQRQQRIIFASHQKRTVWRFQSTESAVRSPATSSGILSKTQDAHRPPPTASRELASENSIPGTKTQAQKTQICEEDEQSTRLPHLRFISIDRQRLVLRIIGGYPVSNGGLDSGNPNYPLFVTGFRISPCSLITYQKGWRGRGCVLCLKDAGK